MIEKRVKIHKASVSYEGVIDLDGDLYIFREGKGYKYMFMSNPVNNTSHVISNSTTNASMSELNKDIKKKGIIFS